MFLPIQTQPFTVYGNGCLIGDVTLTLASFSDIDGNAIAMQGTVMTGTVEPGSGSNEEQIVFTGVTTNSNGTVTLTGVSSVGFASPYTLTSGFLKSHFGGTTFVLSDTAYLYSQFANVGGNNTFTGTTTFTISPIIPTVSSSAIHQAASVEYANSLTIGSAPKASNTVFGIAELSVAPVTASVPIAVGQNDPLVSPVSLASLTSGRVAALAGNSGTPNSSTNTFVTQAGFQNGTEVFAATGGSSTVYTLTLSPVPSAYVTGERIYFKTNVASGTAPTINKNSLGAKSIYKMTTSGTASLALGDFGTNQMVVAEYDGAAYQILNPTANTPTNVPKYASGVGTTPVTATTQNIAHGLGIAPKFVRITAIQPSGTTGWSGSFSWGVYNGTTASYIAQGKDGANNVGTAFSGAGQIIFISTSATQGLEASVTVNATNIILSFALLNGTYDSNAYPYMWEAGA